MTYPQLKYANVPLDRADALRRDPDWLANRLRHPYMNVIPVWRDRNLIKGFETPHMHIALCRQETGARVIEAATELVFLGGTDNDLAFFAADLSDRDWSRLDKLTSLHWVRPFSEVKTLWHPKAP